MCEEEVVVEVDVVIPNPSILSAFLLPAALAVAVPLPGAIGRRGTIRSCPGSNGSSGVTANLLIGAASRIFFTAFLVLLLKLGFTVARLLS